MHLSKRREPVGNLGIFRSDLSVDAVCTQRACAGLKTEGGGAGASFRARATLGRRAFSGRLNVACVGPRVQRVVDAFGKLVNSPLANNFHCYLLACLLACCTCIAGSRLIELVLRLVSTLETLAGCSFRIFKDSELS